MAWYQDRVGSYKCPDESEDAYNKAVLHSIIQGTIGFQTDLYKALKADPVTKNLTVIGPALGGTYAPTRSPIPCLPGA